MRGVSLATSGSRDCCDTLMVSSIGPICSDEDEPVEMCGGDGKTWNERAILKAARRQTLAEK